MPLKGPSELSEFVIIVEAKKGVSPADAFVSLRKATARRGIDFSRVYQRSFRMVLRNAMDDRENFISRKLKKATSQDKVMCLPISEGYIFFGKIYDPYYIP